MLIFVIVWIIVIICNYFTNMHNYATVIPQFAKKICKKYAKNAKQTCLKNPKKIQKKIQSMQITDMYSMQKLLKNMQRA